MAWREPVYPFSLIRNRRVVDLGSVERWLKLYLWVVFGAAALGFIMGWVAR